MLDPDNLVDTIWNNDASRISAINLLMGVRIGQFNDDQLAVILRWWSQHALQTSSPPERIAKSLGALCEVFEGFTPKDFVSPAVPLEDPHILDRRGGGLTTSQRGASVRDAKVVHYWADTQELEDNLIDLTANPDQIISDTLAEYADIRWMLQLKPGVTITNPRRSKRAVFFYTKADDIRARLDTVEFARRADTARDALGLVEQAKGDQVILIEFSPVLAEDREDRGRPTAIDAAGYARFACFLEETGSIRDWGFTADLARFEAGRVAAGLPERVCGPFPPPSAGSVQVELRLLGFVKLPRDDSIGKLDKEFSSALQLIYEKMEPGINPKDRLRHVFVGRAA